MSIALVGAGGMLVNRIKGALISPYDRDGEKNCECGRLPAGPTGRVDYFGYIRRDFPSFLVEPWKWLFGGWPIIRGVMNVETGNITITPKLILWLRKNVDPAGEWIGFHEVVKGDAARVVIEERDRIRNLVRALDDVTQEELDRLSFIEGLERDGVFFDPTEEPVGEDQSTGDNDQVDSLREIAAAFKEKAASKDLVSYIQESQSTIANKLEELEKDFKNRKASVTRAAVKAAREEVQGLGCKCAAKDAGNPKKTGGK
jgi:hypothetical protein